MAPFQMTCFVLVDRYFLESVIISDVIVMRVRVYNLYLVLGDSYDNVFDIANAQSGVDEQRLIIAKYQVGANLLHVVGLLNTPGSIFNFFDNKPICHGILPIANLP
jgi:hypothetical protein